MTQILDLVVCQIGKETILQTECVIEGIEKSLLMRVWIFAIFIEANLEIVIKT